MVLCIRYAENAGLGMAIATILYPLRGISLQEMQHR